VIIFSNRLGENSGKTVENSIFKGDNLSVSGDIGVAASKGVETLDLFPDFFPSEVNSATHS
jgi:hypothetical protein